MGSNPRNPAVRRIMQEVKEMQEVADPTFTAAPVDDDLFEWHFTIRGPPDSPYSGGIYHGRILLPIEYPLKPPDIMFLSESGRFEVKKKICLSNSAYHSELWQPSWNIRTMLTALIGFMPTPGEGAVGSLDYPPEEVAKLAKKSIHFKCDRCGLAVVNALPPLEGTSSAPVNVSISPALPPSKPFPVLSPSSMDFNGNSVAVQSEINEQGLHQRRVEISPPVASPSTPVASPSTGGERLSQTQSEHVAVTRADPINSKNRSNGGVYRWGVLEYFALTLFFAIIGLVVRRVIRQRGFP